MYGGDSRFKYEILLLAQEILGVFIRARTVLRSWVVENDAVQVDSLCFRPALSRIETAPLGPEPQSVWEVESEPEDSAVFGAASRRNYMQILEVRRNETDDLARPVIEVIAKDDRFSIDSTDVAHRFEARLDARANSGCSERRISARSLGEVPRSAR